METGASHLYGNIKLYNKNLTVPGTHFRIATDPFGDPGRTSYKGFEKNKRFLIGMFMGRAG